MKNEKSTIAMKLAHRLAKQFPKTSFRTAMMYAWKLVRIDLTIAKRVLVEGYKIRTIKQQTIFGIAYGIEFYKQGVKQFFKKLLGKDDSYTVTRWNIGFIN